MVHCLLHQHVKHVDLLLVQAADLAIYAAEGFVTTPTKKVVPLCFQLLVLGQHISNITIRRLQAAMSSIPAETKAQ